MDNVIAVCYVISTEMYTEPTIYLRQPMSHEGRKVHMFYTPFEAKAFIRTTCPSSDITVSKEEPTQLSLVRS